ncbi:dipeptidase [Dactylosporangium sp. NBC_01737]|jgi:membrane dipeptidase|uniref:dipeptidase n=1 Tax=Dactylosporangium sp. NBC_01737 TaxID=2975959 RepID=UPI002E1328DC|nr:dipeptidase [Dactylosporangium sp. NBC_01737]
MSGAIPVIDGHNDLAWRMRMRAEDLHTDIPRLRSGGVRAQFWSVYVPGGDPQSAATVKVLEQIDLVHRLIEANPGDLALATTAGDVQRIADSGRIASLLGAEGGHCLDDSLGVLRSLYRLGVRYLTLTHGRNTAWADSATDEPRVGGLSAFGVEVVRELNRLGMMADLSHVAPSTMHAALDVSTAPAFFSHSSARALCDHPRNVPDDVLARVRDTGGVVMVTFVPFFLNEACRQWGDELYRVEDTIPAEYGSAEFERLQRAWIAANPCPPSSVRDVADHVEHVRDVAGIGAVGLGGDFDGTEVLPEGLHDVSTYPVLFDELRGRGWSDADLRKLGWDNTLRVLKDTCG